MNKITYSLTGIVALALVAVAAFFMFSHTQKVEGASTQVPGETLRFVRGLGPDTQTYYTFFVATSTTATSTTGASSQDPGFMRVDGAKDVIFYFSRGDVSGHGNTGSSLFKVQVTPDGTAWFDYPELAQIQVSSTGDAFFTRVSSTTISAATTTVQYAMEDLSYYGVRCITVKTTDGEATCRASATF